MEYLQTQLYTFQINNFVPMVGHKKAPRIELEIARSFINTHLHEQSLTATAIAAAVPCSQEVLERMFKKWNDCTIIQYLNLARMERAEIMLRETDEPIYSIARSCGFDETSYFDKVFKKHFGSSPGAYRKNYNFLRKNSNDL